MDIQKDSRPAYRTGRRASLAGMTAFFMIQVVYTQTLFSMVVTHESICIHMIAICYADAYNINIKLTIFGGIEMATAVRISEKLVNEAKKFSRVDHRSITGQIEHWAKIGKCAEENPDLTYSLIKEILMGLEELEQGERSEYKFG